MELASQKNKNIRLEPQAIEAEKAVLGSMLLSKEAVPRAMTFLTPESFFDSNHKIIFKNDLSNFLIECNKDLGD